MATIIEGAYLRDILAQPAALDRTVDRLEMAAPLRGLAARLRDGDFRQVVLTGMGTSLAALYPLHLTLVDHGITSFWVDTSELVYYQARLLAPDTLVVAVSQSGQSAETLRLIEVNAGRAPIVGVTNTPESALGTRASAVLLTDAGTESTVACKTYVTAMAALAALGAVLAGGDEAAVRQAIGGAGAAAAAYLSDWRAHVEEAAAMTDGIRRLFYAGRGRSLAAALAAGLITKEATYVPAEGMTTASFRHGPIEMLDEATLAIVFEGDPRTRRLNQGIVKEIGGLGHRVGLIGPSAEHRSMTIADVPAPVQPVVEILPVQMLTLGLAARAGVEAGRFRLTTKVTATE